jgi:hypothetical protein
MWEAAIEMGAIPARWRATEDSQALAAVELEEPVEGGKLLYCFARSGGALRLTQVRCAAGRQSWQWLPAKWDISGTLLHQTQLSLQKAAAPAGQAARLPRASRSEPQLLASEEVIIRAQELGSPPLYEAATVAYEHKNGRNAKPSSFRRLVDLYAALERKRDWAREARAELDGSGELGCSQTSPDESGPSTMRAST